MISRILIVLFAVLSGSAFGQEPDEHFFNVQTDIESDSEIVFDAELFLDRLETRIYRSFSRGYALRVIKGGETLGTRVGGLAQVSAEDDGPIQWTASTKMHVASTSKAVTVLAMLRVMRERGISIDAGISQFLPDYWVRGPGINEITIEHLFTHTSGISNGLPTYKLAREAVAQGVATKRNNPLCHEPKPLCADSDNCEQLCLGHTTYSNTNFVLARVVSAFLEELFDPSMGSQLTVEEADETWDGVTEGAYESMVRRIVMAPAGIPEVSLTPPVSAVFGYAGRVDETRGFTSGDSGYGSGAIGWYMSLDDMSALVRRFMGPDPDRQTILNRELGYASPFSPGNVEVDGNSGSFIVRRWGGRWVDADDRSRRVSNSIYFFPGNIQLITMYNTRLPSRIELGSGAVSSPWSIIWFAFRESSAFEK